MANPGKKEERGRMIGVKIPARKGASDGEEEEGKRV